MITVCLHMLIMFTSAAKWKIVAGKAGDVYVFYSCVCLFVHVYITLHVFINLTGTSFTKHLYRMNYKAFVLLSVVIMDLLHTKD